MTFWRISVQILVEVPGFRCRYLVRFWRVPVQIPVEVPKGSRCRYLVRFWRVSVQIPGETSDTWCRYSVRFQKEVRVPGEVPEGFGAHSR